MNELLAFYQQQAATLSSDIPWVASMQKKAVADFVRMGFPTKKDEDWKYTAVDSFLQHRFESPKPAANLTASKNKPSQKLDGINLAQALQVAIVNGVACEIKTASPFPNGVIIEPLAQALSAHADKIKPYLNQIMQAEHGFHAMNTAFLQQGLFVYLPAGVRVEEPILISHAQDQAGQAVHYRHLIIAEPGSTASIVEDFHGEEGCCYFTNSITEIYAAAKATLNHYKIQRESKSAYHVGHLFIKQAEESQVMSHSFSLGGKLVRSDITIGLHEPKARCLMNGVYAPGEGQHIDHHTLVNHNVPDCLSEQDYKGILKGRSRAVFNGRVVVAKGAQKTQAKQQNKNLLLAKDAEIDTKPQLEIFADDVICTHGATVGQLDEDALFYLAARGIDHEQACSFLTEAFAAQNLHLLNNTELSSCLGTLLNQQLR